jgi:hypothetical protein
MKHYATWMIALAACASPAFAGTDTVVLVDDKALCDHAPPLKQASLIEASRNGNSVNLVVTAELNCANVPDKPELRVTRNAATLSLSTRSPSGAAAACLCAHRMTFRVSGLYKDAKTIYYVQDGEALGHVDAP